MNKTGKAKITTQQAARIKAYLSQGWSLGQIAREFGIGWHSVRDIRRNKTFKYVAAYRGELRSLGMGREQK